MKKKILSLLMVFAFGFTITGCDATMDDVKNQANKMQEIIDEGTLFEKDWAFTATTSDGEESATAIMKKDGDNYYIKYVMGQESEEIIMIKDSSTYTVYNTSEKVYTIVGASEVEESFDLDALMGTYDSYHEALEGMEEGCAKEEVTCELEKNLFGKLTITISQNGSDDYITMIIKKGKLLAVSGVMDGTSINYEYDYGNQKIEAPENKSEYKYITA